MSTVMFAPSGVTGRVNLSSGAVSVAADGTITVADDSDVNPLLAAGFLPAIPGVMHYTTPIAPAAASAAATISSVTMTNGGLTIAAQPTVGRQIAAVVGAGTVAITAGTLSVDYLANDGTDTIDEISLALAASGSKTVTLTKGALYVNSATIAGLTGGASPFLYAGLTAAIAVPIPPRSASFTIRKEVDTATNQATLGVPVTGALGCFTPNNAPNATQTFAVWYSFLTPA